MGFFFNLTIFIILAWLLLSPQGLLKLEFVSPINLHWLTHSMFIYLLVFLIFLSLNWSAVLK